MSASVNIRGCASATAVLRGIDLEIPSGQTVAVIGRPARASRPCCAY